MITLDTIYNYTTFYLCNATNLNCLRIAFIVFELLLQSIVPK